MFQKPEGYGCSEACQSHSDITILAERVCTVFPHCLSLRIPNVHGLEFFIFMVWPSNIPNNQYTTDLLVWNVSQTWSLGLMFMDVREAWPGTFVLSPESVLGSPARSYDLNENVTTNSIYSCAKQILMKCVSLAWYFMSEVLRFNWSDSGARHLSFLKLPRWV